MAQVIAGIYKIEKEIGSGGGGVVYLGRHIRLDKAIVLKADKRNLTVGDEAVRREVDMLKNLSHTYIPQVYDFVQEDGVVYTVMDYIDGVSLDKVLACGRTIPQKQIIGWACQLLEALGYLHGQEPHGILHGDIKPANIMLRTNGDICLIDYNIALALGEDGAVQVGYSRGYASPEHYGSSSEEDEETEIYDPDKTEVLKPALTLDVRSDIYSLGATLYHLLSGKKPKQSAFEVEKLTSTCCSEQVAEIINKAMNPNPDERYQTAGEMLDAFLNLRRNDKRVRKNRRRFACAMALSGITLIVGGCLTFVGMRQTENHQKDLTLSSYSRESLAEGDVAGAVDYAMQAVQKTGSVLEAPVTAEAQSALADALGIYDLSDGFKSYGKIQLESAPFDISVSPGQTRFAVEYAYETAIFDMGLSEPVAVFPIEKSALSDCVFADEDTVIFAGEDGVQCYSLSGKETLWKGGKATNIAISGNREVVACVNRDASEALVYRVKDGEKIGECNFEDKHMPVASNDTFADPKDYIFELDQEGKQLAVSFSDGALTIFNINDPDDDLIVWEESDSSWFCGGFSGKYFTYGMESEQQYFLGIIDTGSAEYIGTMDSEDAFDVYADEEGIYIANGNVLEVIDPETLEEKELAYTEDSKIELFCISDKYSAVLTEDSTLRFYDAVANSSDVFENMGENDFIEMTDRYVLIANRDESAIRILQLEDHKDTEILSYDPDYEHDEARISEDRKTVMLFNYKGFRIYDTEGNLTAETELPDADQIYDQQYCREDGTSRLEVTWYDGTVRAYGEDGSLLSEEKGEAPSKDLEETFYTSRYRIVSSLHDAPQVYDADTDSLLKSIDEDAYLTYVEEVNEYILIQFVRSTGEKYGVLYDGDLNELASLPYLADVCEDALVFDYPTGDIRTGKIYSLDELIAMGEEYANLDVEEEVR